MRIWSGFVIAILLIFTFFSTTGLAVPVFLSGVNNTTVMKYPNQEKTIGIIGGVSWESSIEYYRQLNQIVNSEIGGLHSPKVIMYSIEFEEFSNQERLANKGNWTLLNSTVIDAAKRVKDAGADFIAIASNTVNSRADLIEEKVGIPVLRIMDTTGDAVEKQGITKVALLGTKYTMEEDFYRKRLEEKYGLDVIIPNETERDYINSVIFDELCKGIITNQSREGYVRIINRLADEEGAEGVILGCTEIPLLIHQSDVKIPTFDSMNLHVKGILRYAFNTT